MSFVVETGGGLIDATAYVTPSYVTSYLTDRARETENSWSTQATARQQEACIVAASYIDLRWGPSLKGSRLNYWVAGRAAFATITFSAAPLANEVVTIGTVTYRFVSTLAAENDVLIGGTAALSAANLATAVNSGGDDSTVHEYTRPNQSADASVDGAVVTVTAVLVGSSGNDVPFTTDVTGATISTTGTDSLGSGIDSGQQALEFPRRNLYDRDGIAVTGIPRNWKQANAEYAVRSLATGGLLPDPTVDDGATVQRQMDKAGPLETETEYVEGAPVRIFRPYPAADRLLEPYLKPAGAYR